VSVFIPIVFSPYIPHGLEDSLFLIENMPKNHGIPIFQDFFQFIKFQREVINQIRYPRRVPTISNKLLKEGMPTPHVKISKGRWFSLVRIGRGDN
jgi:hypothetical protein